MAEDLDEDFEEDVDEGGGGGSGKKGGKKLLLMVVLPLLLVVGALAGAYFAGLADPVLDMLAGGEEQSGPAPEVMTEGQGGGAGVPVSAAVFYDLPEMLVDINSANSRKRTFLKLRVALELSSAADTAQVEAMMPRVIDNFQTYLRELRVEDLQGAEGMYRLREELIVRVNNAVRPAKVNDVLFKEMLIQ
ncbi:Flagellar biosynthesis protein FliL [Caenispirillum salinarum AK4]|uniref:Flagellar protein FliL n=1 Tax=Caenispirillum salinarum AK4 TaxID=1238182 RepID=K9GPU4_9PROT|nr:flagellar basal body-associated FliL family protein [Caenispirillum salinarum]EKV26699.1 Flagellar biosynthesis protein FliL [Caenispirillum salinarum AK4]